MEYLARKGSSPGALFQWDNRVPMSKTKFVEAVCQALTAASLPAKDYSGHSFRIGAATTAATAGLEDSSIQTLGRWRNSAYQLYIRISPQHLTAMAFTLFRCAALFTHVCMYVCMYACTQ